MSSDLSLSDVLADQLAGLQRSEIAYALAYSDCGGGERLNEIYNRLRPEHEKALADEPVIPRD